jgi:hypothetical protein
MRRGLAFLTQKPVLRGATTEGFMAGKILPTVDVSPARSRGHSSLRHLQPLYSELEDLAVSIRKTYGLSLAVQLLVHGVFIVAMVCYLTDVSLVKVEGRTALSNFLMFIIHLVVAYRILASAEALIEMVSPAEHKLKMFAKIYTQKYSGLPKLLPT